MNTETEAPKTNWLKSTWHGLADYFTAEDSVSDWLSTATPRAQQVLQLAQKEAVRLNHNYVGTEHALLGIILTGPGCGYYALTESGLDLEKIRAEIEKLAGPSTKPVIGLPVPLTPRLRRALALARKEARDLHHSYLGTEHLLLGLIREGDGVAARVLLCAGATYASLRQLVAEQDPPDFSADEGRS